MKLPIRITALSAALVAAVVGVAALSRPDVAKPLVGLAAPAPLPGVAEIQAALDQGGTVVVPAGVYELSEPLRLTQPGTSLIGAGQGKTVFRSRRTDHLPAVEVCEGCWGFLVEGFSVDHPDGITERNYAAPGHDPADRYHPEYADAGRVEAIKGGTTVGIGVGVRRANGEKGSGTICGNGEFKRVAVSGFHTGWKIGDWTNGTCGSEVDFSHCGAHYAKAGWLFEGGGNALNFALRSPGLTRCWDGVKVSSGGQVHIDGGSSAYVGYYGGTWDVGAVIKIEWAGVFSVTNFRMESPAGRLVQNVVAEAVTNLTVRGCEISGPSVGTGPKEETAAVFCQGNANLTVEGCRFDHLAGVLWHAPKQAHLSHGQVSVRSNAVGGFGPLRLFGGGDVRRVVELNQRITPVGNTTGRWPSNVKR